jgi:hypothetical protein
MDKTAIGWQESVSFAQADDKSRVMCKPTGEGKVGTGAEMVRLVLKRKRDRLARGFDTRRLHYRNGSGSAQGQQGRARRQSVGWAAQKGNDDCSILVLVFVCLALVYVDGLDAGQRWH